MNKSQFDAIVVGGGAAGLYTALSLASMGDRQIALITKDNLTISASDWAQGGIAAVVSVDDSTILHAEDTLQAGVGLCESEAVEVLVNAAKPQIEKLIEFGVDFDRHGDSLALTLEAAHSRRRVLHAADATGRALVSTLAKQVLEQPNIHVLKETLVLDLCMERGRCVGAFCLDLAQKSLGETNAPELFLAPVVVLATGGGAQVFAQTTNPTASTGDGVAIAWRAGALIRDMEFVQFHPTALAVTGAPRFLISEAVRGEGAHLIDAKGDRFAFTYHPQGELAPRDVVSRAIFTHLQTTGEPTVFLDLSPISPETIAYRFPNIIKICQKWQIDIFSHPIPVTPAAHYCMGGIVTDTWGKSSLLGLYAVGETASTGVHGANRLASNSLLECFVFGARLAEGVKQSFATSSQIESLSNPRVSDLAQAWEQKWSENLQAMLLQSDSQVNPQAKLQGIKTALRELTWQAAGICRQADEMVAALAQIQQWRKELAQLTCSDRLWGETCNLADFAYLLVRSALFRTESRGAHYRSDYPSTDPEWQCHTAIAHETINRQPLRT
ncbi:L-aspartate oxidase [Tumidithrix elongata RA019]|uniref:L-aspartate oxidase n=1 Tax=Tumidithrix elongata BACA0141 TaxID=2716417 RepID=A0AAW9PQU4_9CYAN|nr:L-aspartate oxidase [Tumidithrix elongata RA019]